jgi:hypothetical protein
MKAIKHSLFLIFFFVWFASAGAVDLIDPPKAGRQFETLSFRFVENLPFDNPFDLETNRVELVVHQPDFSKRVLSFFYDGMNADSVQQWEARFTPKQTGVHGFAVSIEGKLDPPFEVSVAANSGKKLGGLKLSDRFGTFAYESGEPFRGIGLNVCWAEDYEYYFKKLQAAGINVTRIWMCPWNLSFEWQETGLGRYNLQSARRLDEILALAEKYGIFVMLCMDYHGVARKGLGFFRENRWEANPYNLANGGPCADAKDLFTNEDARKFFKRRYKYIVSRFGHSRALATWEFYNEADLMAGQAIPVNRWHIEMAEYIKSVDVHQRLVSSSATRSYPEKLVDAFKSPAMDYVMFHDYNSLNVAPHYTDLHEAVVEYYQKPFVLGEFGVEFRGADHTHRVDPQGIGLHNGLWAGWFNQTPITPMSWWWDNYIDPHDLWKEFANLSAFAEAMNFNSTNLEFHTLAAGFLTAEREKPAPCMVRAIYSGEQSGLWFKNMDYQWSLVHEGRTPAEIGSFAQVVPGLAPGRYVVLWFDPQAGTFLDKKTEATTSINGELMLTVPPFSKDMACLLTRQSK